MSKSSLLRRARKGRAGYRLIWRIDLLPPGTLRGLRLGASATAIAVALLAGPMPAFGADECGDVAPGGTATCTPAGNPYADGIAYTVDDLTIVLAPGVAVVTDAADKDAVRRLTRHVAMEEAAHGITVNAVGPGRIDTEMVREEIDDERKARYAGSFPISRLGAPSEVAELVAFLASDRAAYITGAALDISGGDLMG